MMSGGDGQPETLGGVTVTLGGEHAMGESAETDMTAGGFAFTGLRAGTYTITISGFPEDVSFETVMVEVEVEVGDVGQADFTGHFIRTSAVAGQVIIEGEGLPGVTVTLSGGPAGDSHTTMTDVDGMYRFAELRPGAYTVSIDGFDQRDYEFASTSQDVSVNLDETGTVSFTGTLLRTSGIAGRVSVGGMGLGGVTVTISGADDEQSAMTDASGQYAIAGLAAGDYMVTISGYDAVEYTFEGSQSVTLEMDATAIVNFAGAALRTASVTVSVTADGAGVAGAAATLVQVTGPMSGNVLGVQATGEDGSVTFGPLLAGVYRVDISVDSDEIDFETMSWQGEVATDEAAMATFAGSIVRTASIGGSVTVDGEGMSGVAVMLSGGEGDQSAETGEDGSYSFGGLRKGDYTVSITNPDDARYEFTSTSESVSLAVGQEQSVSFAGSMVRASSISGTVSVAGSGVEGVTVTLSGAADAEASTDAGGLYSFTGLGAGDYTVAMSLSEEQATAYVFDADGMSETVTLGDTDNQTVNFSGAHATTASVSGMLFIDEATKNDMHDEGERPLAHAGIPVALVGPGVNEQQLGATDSTGAFSFSSLRAGSYQLVVAIDATVAAALAANDLAFGGPATGYAFDLAVGEAKSQAIPFDITHTTVNFSVSLRHGEEMGAALPGATVTLYSAMTDGTMLGSGETGEDGSVAIKVARAGTSENTVHASVSAEGYEVADGMTAVTWNPQYTMTAGANANDIVNLNVDVSFRGATVETEAGGGDALKGWALSVMMGEGDDAEAVEGDHVPEMLDDMGMASFETMVDADDLPAMYTFDVAADQDDKMDGGESYEGSAIEYTHNGLSLMGTMDAGMIEVAYTTQTLKVYVHQELDQVEGYTGNIIGGDERDGKGDARKVSVGIRYIDTSGRSRSFEASDSIDQPDNNGDGGEWVFSNVPADHNVIVQAAKADQTDASIMLLTYSNAGGMHNDELATYRNLEENGVTSGAFGAMGGFSHTVELCPLQAVDPTDQDHGECASFAYVNTHSVTGLIWKNEVLRSNETPNDDGFKMGPEDDGGPTFVAGKSVSLSPAEGKNLAGDEESHTTTEKPVRGPGETSKGTEVLDETHQFAFDNIAAGVYTLSVSDGWRASKGPKDATDKVGNALNPLAGDVELDVTPATTTVYGYVRDSKDFPAKGVTVNVNGVEAVTDVHGRYIAEYVPNVASRKIDNVTHKNMVFVETDHEDNKETLAFKPFVANARINQDVKLSGVGTIASVSGKITASGSGAPIAGVSILVDDKAPLNVAKSGANKGKLVTGADGTYMATFPAKELGQTAEVSATTEDGWSFVPAVQRIPAHGGAAISGIDFTGFLHATISGRVVGPDGNAMGGVAVTATNVVPGEPGDDVSSTTNARGTFVLSVPFGTYTIMATKANYTFTYPAEGQVRSVAQGQSLDFGTIKAATAGALDVQASRMRQVSDNNALNGDETQRWANTISVTYTADAENKPEGFETPTYTIQTNTGTDGAWTDATPTQVTRNGDPVPGSFRIPTPDANDGGDGEFMVRVVTAAEETTASDPPAPFEHISGTATVTAVDPSASDVSARRQAEADSDEAAASGNFIRASWSAVTNINSDFRVVAQVTAASLGGSTVWVVLAEADANDRAAVSENISTISSLAVALPSGVTTQTVSVTEEELAAAISIAVESVQGTADADDGPKWKPSTAVSLSLRASGG